MIVPDINKQFWDFVYSHVNDNCLSLRLKYSNVCDFDVTFAIDQIEARQKVKDKLPFVALNKDFIFPSLLSAEQCTCEAVADFKANYIHPNIGWLLFLALSQLRLIKEFYLLKNQPLFAPSRYFTLPLYHYFINYASKVKNFYCIKSVCKILILNSHFTPQ